MPAQKAHSSERLSRRAEQRLIARAKRGCQESARKLIDAHKDRLAAFVWRMVRNHHDTEEICQDAFLRAFASLDSFSAEYRFSTWLFTIAYRLCLNWMRRRQALSGEVDFSTVAAAAPDVAHRVAQSEEARRLKSLIWQAVEQLPAAQRATVLLFYREGQSCQEIAEVLGMPVATVKSHLHRARARLRDWLEPAVADDWSRLKALSETA